MFHPYVSCLQDCASQGGGKLDIERCIFLKEKKNTFFLLQRDFFFKQKIFGKERKATHKEVDTWAYSTGTLMFGL